MSKSKGFMTQIINSLKACQSGVKEEESSKRSSFPEDGDEDNSEQPQRQIIVRKKEKNFAKRIFKLVPSVQPYHIDKVFGFVALNTKAIENPGYEQSYLYSYLQDRVVQRVEFYEHAVVIEMAQPEAIQPQLPTEYFIEKYKSRGDVRFYDMAVVIEEITKLLSSNTLPQSTKPELLKKWLDQLGNKLYVALFGTRRMAISKTLLAYLDYDLEEFAVAAVKFRTIHTELFSSISYYTVMKQFIKSLQYSILLSLGKLSLQEYQKVTQLKISDFIRSKNHVESFCDLRCHFLTPNCFVTEIERIHYKRDELAFKHLLAVDMRKAIRDEKQRVNQGEYRTIRKFKELPKGLFNENKGIMAQYKSIQPSLSKDGCFMECLGPNKDVQVMKPQ